MTDKNETLSQIEQHLSSLDELFRDVTLDSNYVHVLEAENAELRMENEKLKRENELLSQSPSGDKKALRTLSKQYGELRLQCQALERQAKSKEKHDPVHGRVEVLRYLSQQLRDMTLMEEELKQVKGYRDTDRKLRALRDEYSKLELYLWPHAANGGSHTTGVHFKYTGDDDFMRKYPNNYVLVPYDY